MADQIGIGIIGLGHWGPNYVRAFSQCGEARVVMCADPDPQRRAYVAGLYRGVNLSPRADDVLGQSEVDAVVIATPTRTHYALARSAIDAGKHVLLEKPMCSTLVEAEDLVALARTRGTALMQGHIFVYNNGIEFVRDRAVGGDFGALQYVHATRTNLGPIRYDVNVVHDLATHELTIFDYIFGAPPRWVSATGSRVLGTEREDVAFVTMEYPGGVLAHVHVSWLDPQKTRTLTLVGARRMVVWNDIDANEPVRIFDKGVMEERYYDSFGEFQFSLRDADILIPKVTLREPLRRQVDAFIRRVKDGTPTRAEPDAGLRVMRALDAIDRSLANDGRRVHLG